MVMSFEIFVKFNYKRQHSIAEEIDNMHKGVWSGDRNAMVNKL